MELNFDVFLNDIQNGCVQNPIVLTANQRQSRQITELLPPLFEQQKVVTLPAVSPISVWFGELWRKINLSSYSEHEFLFGKKLINDFESRYLWFKVTEDSHEIPPLVNHKDFIRQIQSAYDICESFLVPREELFDAKIEETELYLHQLKKYERVLTTRSLIDKYQLLRYLVDNAFEIPDTTIYIYGFSELAPLYQRALANLSGATIREVSPPRQNIDIASNRSPTKQDELHYAASWAKKHIATSNKNSNKYSLAIVVPDLAAERQHIERAFLKALEADRYITGLGTLIPSRFDISVGQTMDKFGLSKTARSLSKLIQNRQSKSDLTYLLQSPYWGLGINEFRQQILDKMSETSESEANLFSYLPAQNLQEPDSNPQADLFSDSKEPSLSSTARYELKILHAIRQRKQDFKGLKHFREWVSIYKEYLQACGFPGKAELTSLEYQVCKRLFDSLTELESIDSLNVQAINFRDFEHALDLKLENDVFQAEVEEPEIRILGLMEAAGLVFDKCLVLGLEENTLPQAAKPHPLLPISIQKKYNTPKSSASREYDYAERFLSTLIQSSKSICLSYYSANENENCEPSPLLTKYLIKKHPSSIASKLVLDDTTNKVTPCGNHALIEEQDQISQHIKEAANFSEFVSVPLGSAPPIPQNSEIRGGAYYLDLHWANPLFAFFKYRLRVEQEEVIERGVSKRERGSNLHSMLHHVYKKHPSKSAIQNFLSSSTVREELRALADRVILNNINRKATLPPVYHNQELQILAELVEQVLIFDANRDLDFDIFKLEKAQQLEILNRQFSTRIDRVDCVNGDFVVIDYKTSQPSLTGLAGKSTSDFQLPFYCLSLGDTPSALAYLAIDRTGVSSKGLSDPCKQEFMPGLIEPSKIRMSELPTTWEDTVIHWQENITSLVSEIIRGQVNFLIRKKSTQSFYEYYLAAVRPEERNGH